MWKFKPKQEYEYYKQSEFLNGNKIIKMIKNGKYRIFQLDNDVLTKLSNKTVDENLHSLSALKSVGNRLIVSSGNNSLFEYKNGKWNTFQFDDRFNHKDSLEMRRMNKIVELNGQIYCLSYAYKLKSIDTTQSGVVEFRVDTTYSEIFSFDGGKLDLVYKFNAKRLFDITSDNDFIWAISDKLYKFKNNKILETYDIRSIAGLNNHTVFYKIATFGKYVYLLKDFDPSSENREPLLLKFHKETNETEVYQFPLYESYGTEKYDVFPGVMNNMEFINGEGIISTNKGVYKFNGNKIEYIDVFSQFLSEIPEVFLPYLSTSDISIDGNQIVISTNVGLIYTDTFTDVEITNDNSNTAINLYPNVFNSSNQTINLESNIDINVESIVIYETSGRKIQEIKNVNNLTKGINETIQIDLNSGMYFLAIMSDNENFIYPIIINK